MRPKKGEIRESESPETRNRVSLPKIPCATLRWVGLPAIETTHHGSDVALIRAFVIDDWTQWPAVVFTEGSILGVSPLRVDRGETRSAHPMHVLIVTNYFAPESGAAAVRLTRLGRELHRRGHQVTVLTSLPHYPQGRIYDGYRGQLTAVHDDQGLRVVQTWLLATPNPRIRQKLLSQISFMLTAMLRGLTLPAPDVVLIEAQPVFTAFAGALIARLKRAPYVLNVSDLWPEHLLSVGALTEGHTAYRLARGLMDRTYRGATSIVAMSPHWAEGITARLTTQVPVEVVYNGVDLTTFRPDAEMGEAFRRRYSLSSGKVVSFIGTLSTQYDLDVMLHVARLLGSRADVEIVFIGRGSQGAELQQASKAIPNLKRIPWLDHAEMPAAWNASSVTFFALRDHPLYRGTIPAKLYEALACGVPIVAACDGIGGQMIEASGGGTIAPCGDADELAAAIEATLDDPEHRDAISSAGRRYAEEHFDGARVADAYERILHHAATVRNGRT